MSEFFGYNPDRGTWYEVDDYEDGLVIHTKQDTRPVLELNKYERNSGKNDKVGDFNHYARIPATIEVELKQRGLNIYNKNNTKKLLEVIDREYPYLKVTNLKHRIK